MWTGWMRLVFHSWFKMSVRSRIFWRLVLNMLCGKNRSVQRVGPLSHRFMDFYSERFQESEGLRRRGPSGSGALSTGTKTRLIDCEQHRHGNMTLPVATFHFKRFHIKASSRTSSRTRTPRCICVTWVWTLPRPWRTSSRSTRLLKISTPEWPFQNENLTFRPEICGEHVQLALRLRPSLWTRSNTQWGQAGQGTRSGTNSYWWKVEYPPLKVRLFSHRAVTSAGAGPSASPGVCGAACPAATSQCARRETPRRVKPLPRS